MSEKEDTISKMETVEEVAIRLLFKGNQLVLWHLLDFRPRPTWIFAELMELPSKNISKQLAQMEKRTGLVKSVSNGRKKDWYKIEEKEHYYTEQEVLNICEALKDYILDLDILRETVNTNRIEEIDIRQFLKTPPVK